jgi:hypothetical protein
MSGEDLSYKIGVVGPTRVGKTSLITSLLKDGRRLLQGTVVEITPVGTPTEVRLARNAAELRGSLDAREFRSDALRGTEEPFTFRLLLDPGVPGAGIRLDILDYPGTWLDGDRRPPERQTDWDACMEFMRTSTVLLVPIDAAVLMEAAEAAHRRAVPHLLMTEVVEWVASRWAKDRHEHNGFAPEPALLLLCPIKCETYFSDNGGLRDRSAALHNRVQEIYRDVIETVHREAPHAQVWCCPVDTIGCVEVASVDWSPDALQPGGFGFTANYRVRHPVRTRIRGIHDVFGLLCAQLVEARQAVLSREALYEREQARRAIEYAERSEGWLSDIWLWLSGAREDRRDDARQAGISAERAAARVAALDEAVARLAAHEPSERAHQL